jgi:hypothetical protein
MISLRASTIELTQLAIKDKILSLLSWRSEVRREKVGGLLCKSQL